MKFRVAGAAITASIAAPALADSNASLVTPSTASMVLTMQLSITTALGTSSDSDTKTIAVVGDGQCKLFGSDPAWSSVTMNALNLYPANASFHFDLYCFPFIGCQSLDVQLSGLTINLTGPSSSAIGANGTASFVNAPVLIQGTYTSTGVATASGAILNNTATTIGCRVQAQPKGTVRFDQLSMAPLTTVIDPASLPAGVTALTITISTNLANTTMSGPWVVINPFDLTGDSLVNAQDIAALLNQWGGPGSGDFSGNGVVDGADVAFLLSNWS
jgi:hypothetical protein